MHINNTYTHYTLYKNVRDILKFLSYKHVVYTSSKVLSYNNYYFFYYMNEPYPHSVMHWRMKRQYLLRNPERHLTMLSRDSTPLAYLESPTMCLEEKGLASWTFSWPVVRLVNCLCPISNGYSRFTVGWVCLNMSSGLCLVWTKMVTN